MSSLPDADITFMKTPFPSPTPAFDIRRLVELLGGDTTPVQRFTKIITVLKLFGKLDELSDMLEQYDQWIFEVYHKDNMVNEVEIE